MTSETPAGEVTQLLQRWRAGDESALTSLMPLVYDELRALARRHLSRERGSHTLQRTALVHEAFLRMVDQTQVDWKCRSQFLGVASQMMRRVLVDHARRRGAAKRGSDPERVDFEAALEAMDDDTADVDFESVHQALERLEALDPAQGRLVELRFFGGLSIQEAAAVMEVSPATAKREWAIARAFLQRELSAGGPA
ncbi:MAG: ECF-type sigma factor [Steroidobacteraceae bacterium]